MSPPLAMWEREAQVVELEKGEAGLGFSILDYQVGHGPEISTDRADRKTGLSIYFIISCPLLH